jgi:multimeric flavodoxin WrbA
MKILIFSGSPRKGNSEAIANRIKQILDKKGVENEIILLRKSNIEMCNGCVEYCNKNLKCCKKDDMQEIIIKMRDADGYAFISPNYFKMPPAIFKNFIDRCCGGIFCSQYFTKKPDFSGKRSIVIAIGTDDIKEIDVCRDNIENFCDTLGIPVVAKKSFKARSELKGNCNDFFENSLKVNIDKKIEDLVSKLCKT